MTYALDPSGDDHPRAPAKERGPTRSLDDADPDDRTILVLMLRGVCADAADMADRLLAHFETLSGVVGAECAALQRVSGVQPEIAAHLRLLPALAVRLARIEACHRPIITSWSALVAYARAALAHRPREQFRALFLDHRNHLMRDELIADGTVDHAPVYPREVVRRALELSASAMILVHNHPSGDPTPSSADIEMTRKIVDAARLFGLKVHDHLVIGREGTSSFKALGLI